MRLTKFGKKIIAILAILVLGVTLTSCLNDSEKDKGYKEAQEAVEGAISNVILDQDNYVVADITLASSHAWYPDVKYSWTSSEADVITVITNADGTITGSVSAPDPEDPRAKTSGEDVYVPVELTVVCTQEAEGKTATATKKFTVKVKCASADVKGTVSEVKSFFVDKMIAAGAVFNNYRETIYAVGYGRVLYQWSKSMVVADEKSAVVVYGNYTDICTVGDLVKVEGNVKSYYGQVEFDTSNVKKLDETDEHASITLPEYKETTINEYTADINASIDAANKIVDKAKYNNYSGATLKVFAKVVQKSESAELQATKDEFGLQDPYTGEIVAIYHYSTDATEDTATFNALVGKYVTIEVITYDRYSSNNCFRVLWNGKAPVEGEAPVLDDEQKVTMAAKAVEAAAETAFAKTYYNGDAFTTPTVKVAEGVNVEWSVSPSELVKDGKWVVTADGTATIKATVSCGDASQEVTVTVNVKVSKPQGDGAVHEFDFGTKEISGYKAEQEMELTDVVTNEKCTVIAHWTQTATKADAPYTDGDVFAVICPTRKDNESKCAYLQFTFKEAVNYIKFDTTWWSASDKTGNASKITKFEVQYKTSADGDWVSVEIPAVSTLDPSKFTTVVANTPNAVAVRIYTETNQTYSSNQSARITVDNVKFYTAEPTVVAPSDEELAKQTLESLEVIGNAIEDFDLPTVEGVTWAIKGTTTAAKIEGTVNVVITRGAEDVTVVFVATCKGVTKEFEVVIKAKVEQTSEDFSLTTETLYAGHPDTGGYAAFNNNYEVGGVIFTSNQVMIVYSDDQVAYGKAFQFKGSEGSIANKNAFAKEVKTIEIHLLSTYTGDQLEFPTLYAGSEAAKLTAVTHKASEGVDTGKMKNDKYEVLEYTLTYTLPAGATFVKIEAAAHTTYISSIDFKF